MLFWLIWHLRYITDNVSGRLAVDNNDRGFTIEGPDTVYTACQSLSHMTILFSSCPRAPIMYTEVATTSATLSTVSTPNKLI